METKKVTYIYGLIDPRTGEIRYIGKANDPQVRLGHHLCAKLNTPKGHWIKELRSIKLKPDLCIFECVDFDKWEERERWWISFYFENGANLLNANPGGNGCYFHTEETRQRISETLKGRSLSENHKLSLSIAKKGKPLPEKVRLAHIKAATGRPKTKQELEKLSKFFKGRKLTEEHKRKIGDGNRGRVFGEEHRARMERQSSKLTIEQIKEIREYLKQGIPNIELAEKFKVHPNTIYYIKADKIHKRVK